MPPPRQPEPLTAPAVPLTTVEVGAVSTLHEVRDAESRPFLRALGLIDACEIRLCKSGDPCIVQVRSHPDRTVARRGAASDRGPGPRRQAVATCRRLSCPPQPRRSSPGPLCASR